MVKIQQKYFILFKEEKIYCYGHGSQDDPRGLWLPDDARWRGPAPDAAPAASVVYQSQDHTVKIHEETEQVETKLDHGFLHVRLQLTPIVDLCRVEHSHVTTRHHNEPIYIPSGNGQVEKEDEPVQ